MLAPVVLFVYNRADHVKQTLDALSKNDLAKESDLFIFSDGPRKEKDIDAVNAVRKLIKEESWKKVFKTVTIIESSKNKGLANSIISGADSVINKYGRIIVLEDDCVSSKDFLRFMNISLDYYEHDEKVWSIGGYTVNMHMPQGYSLDVYLMGRTCSYAWATWSDRWEKVDWEVKSYPSFKHNIKRRKQFNEYGMDRSKMLDEQQLGIKNSWAIRFCFAMFENNMFTVYPCQSKIRNIGYDVGTHVTKSTNENNFTVELSDAKDEYKLSHSIKVEDQIKKQFAKYFKRNRIKLFIAYICNVILKTKLGR